MLTDEINIHILDIFHKGEKVASIVAEKEIKVQSSPVCYTVQIGDEELSISAEKIQVS